jgi:hypothetical protein
MHPQPDAEPRQTGDQPDPDDIETSEQRHRERCPDGDDHRPHANRIGLHGPIRSGTAIDRTHS